MFVLVQNTAETITSTDGQPGELVWVGDALVRPVRVVEDFVFAEGVQEMPLVPDQAAVE